ncbi:MAG: EthD domain-containing protein [Patulibacter sp.]|nr:EthD domain-containing protein [Patulibacter sp.]
MAPRFPQRTFRSFLDHWRTSHADAVGKLPNLRRYVQYHAVLRDDHPLLPYPGFDACSALSFDSVAAMDDAFASDVFLGAIQADEREFVDKTRFTGVIGEVRTQAGDPDDGPEGRVALATLWRTVEGGDRDALLERLAADDAVAGGRAIDHTQIVTDHAAHATRFPAACDVVDIRGYASPDDALADLWLPGVTELERDLAGRGQAVARHLARPLDVAVVA